MAIPGANAGLPTRAILPPVPVTGVIGKLELTRIKPIGLFYLETIHPFTIGRVSKTSHQ
jgi:hypothetical protein